MKALLLLLLIPISYADADTWNFGDGLWYGDYYHYQICDHVTTNEYDKMRSRCYDLELTVLERVTLDSGPHWLVHAELVSGTHTEYDILTINENYDVKSFSNRYIANSLSNTIFWMHNTAIGLDSIELKVGDTVGSVPSPFSEVDVMITDFSTDADGTDYLLSLSNERGHVWIADSVPLPKEATIYKDLVSDAIIPLYEFVLSDYSLTGDRGIPASEIEPERIPEQIPNEIPEIEDMEIESEHLVPSEELPFSNQTDSVIENDVGLPPDFDSIVETFSNQTDFTENDIGIPSGFFDSIDETFSNQTSEFIDIIPTGIETSNDTDFVVVESDLPMETDAETPVAENSVDYIIIDGKEENAELSLESETIEPESIEPPLESETPEPESVTVPASVDDIPTIDNEPEKGFLEHLLGLFDPLLSLFS